MAPTAHTAHWGSALAILLLPAGTALAHGVAEAKLPATWSKAKVVKSDLRVRGGASNGSSPSKTSPSVTAPSACYSSS